MMQAFYKTKPTQDTPYRQLNLRCEDGWLLQLIGGTKWGREYAKVLKSGSVQNFDEGRVLYDREFIKLQEEGWKTYSPHEPW